MDYGYARVSTKEQNEQRQIIALTQFGLSEKYIYVDDAGENAFAKLDGERRTMKLISSSSFEDDSESIIKEIESNEYKISIKAKKIKENPEAMVFEGTMTVEQPTGEKVTTPIYGECAC